MVGKTSLIFRLINYNAPKIHDATIEDKYKTMMTLENDQSVEIDILDTAGQEDYQGLLDSWVDFGGAFLLVFALNDLDSFLELDSKKRKIEELKKSRVPIVLVGNKCDLVDQRKVSEQEALNKAKEWKIDYIETSAKDNIRCKDAFETLVRKYLKGNKSNSEITVNNKKCCSIL